MHVTGKRKLRRHSSQDKAKNKCHPNNRMSLKREKRYVEKIASLENKIKEDARIHEEEKIRLNLEVETTSGKCKHILDQLKDKIECPVCMEVPRSGPVPVCPNGHFVCQKCKTECCPTCRASMEMGKSLLAVSVIENIEHVCKFSVCEESYALEKLVGHEKICKHRNVSCPYDLCQVTISLSKLLDHLALVECPCCSTKKPLEINAFSPCGRVNFVMPSIEHPASSSLIWPFHSFSYEDTYFLVYVKKFEHFFFFTMVMIGSEEECSKYTVNMMVHQSDSLSVDSEASFKYCGKPCSIDEEKQKIKYSGLTVNNIGMEKIIKKSKVNSFSVSFSIS